MEILRKSLTTNKWSFGSIYFLKHMTENIYDKAFEIAQKAHHDQKDREGQDYINHALRRNQPRTPKGDRIIA